ncbi:MAG: hypothetical protein R3E97_23615 [Candidatus Eisenbacteria bacterium]
MTFLVTAVRICILAALFLAGGGCAERDRDNPFDPRNGETGGHPSAVDAVAGDGEVSLSWDLSGLGDIANLSLQRIQSDGTPVVLEPSIGAIGSVVDRGVRNRNTYGYRILVDVQNGEQLETDTELATPGASIVWFGDASGRGVGRMAPDGRDRLFMVGAGRTVLDAAVDLSGTVWCADYWSGQIVQYSQDGEPLRAVERTGVNVVAYAPEIAQIWAGSYYERSISRYSVTEGRLSLDLQDVGLTEDIEVEPFPGSGIWVATRDEGLVRIEGDRVVRQWTAPDWPVALARDPAGILWVVDRSLGSVSRLDVASGVLSASSVVLSDPRDCALDGEGGLFVADPGRGGLVHVDAGGNETAFVPLSGASGVTRDPISGQLWVTFRDAGEIGTFLPDGTELGRTRVTGTPVKVEGLWQ